MQLFNKFMIHFLCLLDLLSNHYRPREVGFMQASINYLANE
jgi:hypothetical protein